MNNHISDREIQEYLESGAKPSQRMTEHLSRCQECAENLKDYQTLFINLQDTVPHELGEIFTDSTVSAVFRAYP